MSKQDGEFAEFDITPEMIEAGVDELLSHSLEDLAFTDYRCVIGSIWVAMQQARDSEDTRYARRSLSLYQSVGQIPEVVSR